MENSKENNNKKSKTILASVCKHSPWKLGKRARVTAEKPCALQRGHAKSFSCLFGPQSAVSRWRVTPDCTTASSCPGHSQTGSCNPHAPLVSAPGPECPGDHCHGITCGHGRGRSRLHLFFSKCLSSGSGLVDVPCSGSAWTTWSYLQTALNYAGGNWNLCLLHLSY